MKVGVIGTGNMGTILTEALIAGNEISPSDIIIINRTIAKAEKLKNKFTGIKIADSITQLIQSVNIIFLCVKPDDIYPILVNYRQYFTNDHCLVSITSPIHPDWMEKVVASSCLRMIPSITNRALSGATLVTFGSRFCEDWKPKIMKLMSSMSTPVIIADPITRVSSDIVSCGPAFYSFITRKFIEAAVKETGIDKTLAEKLFVEMLIGLGDLLKYGYYTFSELEEKVTVKGGITGEGINILEEELQGVFEKVFQATHQKYNTELEKIKGDFSKF